MGQEDLRGRRAGGEPALRRGAGGVASAALREGARSHGTCDLEGAEADDRANSWRFTIRTPTRRTAAAPTPRARRILGPLVLAVAACGGEAGPAAEVDAAPDTAPALAAEPDPDLVAPPAPVARQILETEEGEATYYADLFQGRRTASGEAFDQGAMMAAHLRYPFGTRLRVTEPSSERSVEVRVVDRGPYAKGRRMPAIIDLSKAAARRLGILDQGRAVVTVEVLEWGEGLPVAG